MTAFLVILFTLSGGFFAGLETGLISSNQFLLYSTKGKKSLSFIATRFLLKKPERLLSTTLIGTNISFVTATILMSRYLRTTGLAWSPWVGSILLAVAMLIFAEIIPKSFFRQNADTVAVKLAPVLVVFYLLFFPIGIILNSIVNAILFITGQHKPSTTELDSKHSLRTLVRLGSREAGISLEDQRIVDDIFDFQETKAREVMIHLHRTLSCPDTMSVLEIVQYAIPENVRFVPIFSTRLDNLIGYIDLEEIVTSSTLTLDALLHKPVFFPDSKRIPDLYRDMSVRKLEVAFLINEYGRVTGIVTPSEIVAEIVRIRPGHKDERYIEIEKISDKEFSVIGVTDMENFQNEIGISLPQGAYDTVGGFLLSRFGYVPSIGETLKTHEAEFTITESDEVHIVSIKVNLKSSSKDQPIRG